MSVTAPQNVTVAEAEIRPYALQQESSSPNRVAIAGNLTRQNAMIRVSIAQAEGLDAVDTAAKVIQDSLKQLDGHTPSAGILYAGMPRP